MFLSDNLYILGQLFGFVALLSLSLLIFSGDTARYFDRFIGMDRLIKFQRKFSFFVLSFSFLHPILFILSGRESFQVFIPDFYVMPLALGVFAFFILIAVMLFSYFYKRISYRVWQYIHILTYGLLFLSLYHAFFWGSNSDKPIFKILYLFILIIFVLGAVYRFLYKYKALRRPRFYIEKIIKNTNNIFSVSLKSDKKLNFKAGQFCFLRLKGRKLYARHPFTISSSPQEDELLFTIKNTGRFTFTLSSMKAGDEVLVDGPFGRFVEKKKSGDLVFIAGGVGITPFRSMALDFLKRKRSGNISLIYCAKSKEDLVFEQDFNKLAQENESFKVFYALSGGLGENYSSSRNLNLNPSHSSEENSSENSSPSFNSKNINYLGGRISPDLIKKAMEGKNETVFYICGPEPLKKTTISILKELEVSKKKIIFEDFFW